MQTLHEFAAKTLELPNEYADKTPDLPNEWYSSIDFDQKINVCVLSFCGFMLATGFGDGSVIICDSETGNNRIYLKKHDVQIISLSFSRHGYYLASLDQIGKIIIQNILTREVLFEKTFSPMYEIQFSPVDNNQMIFKDYDQNLILFDWRLQKAITVSTDVIDACYNPVDGTIVTCINEKVVIFDPETLNVKAESEIECKRGITKIAISHHGTLLIILEKTGIAHLYNVDMNMVFHSFQNPAGGNKWTCMTFDKSDEHVLFSSNLTASCLITCFSTTKTLLTLELNGPAEATLQLFSHPILPVIYTRGVSSVRIWTPTFLNQWSVLQPGFEKVLKNDLYDEKEDEFDEEEEYNDPEIVQIEGGPLDIFSNHNYKYFPNDDDFPDQLLYLPLNIDEAMDNLKVLQSKAA